MNSENIILRGTDNPPLINKDDVLTIEEIDGNFINIYNDFVSLSQANDPTLIYDVDRTYSVDELATYDGRLWLATEISTGVTPIEGSAEWMDVFPTILAHEKNKDTILDEGGANETTVAEIRAFIDAGLTSTTNLSLSTKTGTSFKIESSTGADVTIPQATSVDAGLLNAEDKVKLDNQSGINTGDQTLVSLNAEDVDNKATDFTTINDTLYPTTQAVDTYINVAVPDLVEVFLSSNVELNTNKATTFATINDVLYPSVKAVDDQLDLKVDKAVGERLITSAESTILSNTSGTNTGDQIISDATITTTDITTNNFTTAKHGFVPKGTNVGNFLKDDGTWGIPASGSSGGIVGIANSSGVYTYYATLTLAMTAAVSGNTIELFADITETGSVAITLKSGVKINGNGHTYTLSVNDNTHALICNTGTVELFNWKVVRTGRANGLGGFTLYCYGGNLKAQGVLMENTYGDCVSDGITIYNLQAKGYLNGFKYQFENTKHYECIGESTGTGDGMLSTYSVGCTGIAISGSGISGNGTHLNSIGISTSGAGLSGQTFTGCTGLSTTGTGIAASSEGRNCIGISTSGVGGTGILYSSTLLSSSNYGSTATLYNSYVQSTSSVSTNSSSIYNSTIRCLWNNAGGHCTSSNALSSKEILNSFLEVTNASAYCINGYVGSTWKYSNNSFKGPTVAVNTTNITQGITNIHDNQGNILI